MSPVAATLRDLIGIEPIWATVKPDHDIDAISIVVAGAEMQLELLIAPSAALDLAIEICDAVDRLQEDASG